ncbi:anti-anti-sigma regulatory factor, SpoIIAA [Psychrobacillus sp. OK028]|uniref:STAS domain-containing protein n=1 Tax=Psychrobacillus sp. OK028 TaxID=1884359 RepID=UPI0008922F9A|nr:anti-sigma factor antagonist [Psychrobacillus sp. OK028]SDM99497.1 anti-anti-sigma regulatory factor, SpoIIAA [Psychrobacillus sp. OK028]
MIHEVEKVGDEIIIIRLKGELDHHSTNDIRNEIVPMIKNGSIKVLVWNLKDLHFMDSSGIGLILGRMRELAPIDGQTIIVNPSPTMRKIFQFAGLSPYIYSESEIEIISKLGGIVYGQ